MNICDSRESHSSHKMQSSATLHMGVKTSTTLHTFRWWLILLVLEPMQALYWSSNNERQKQCNTTITVHASLCSAFTIHNIYPSLLHKNIADTTWTISSNNINHRPPARPRRHRRARYRHHRPVFVVVNPFVFRLEIP